MAVDRDAELLARAAIRWGYGVVRGGETAQATVQVLEVSLSRAGGLPAAHPISLDPGFTLVEAVLAAGLAALMMLAALFIDGLDGTLARAVRVSVHTPEINGRRLDDIVDHFGTALVQDGFGDGRRC